MSLKPVPVPVLTSIEGGVGGGCATTTARCLRVLPVRTNRKAALASLLDCTMRGNSYRYCAGVGTRPSACVRMIEGGGSSFSSPRHLTDHLRFHATELPFSCKLEGCNEAVNSLPVPRLAAFMRYQLQLVTNLTSGLPLQQG